MAFGDTAGSLWGDRYGARRRLWRQIAGIPHRMINTEKV
jgi:hypothetical protein